MRSLLFLAFCLALLTMVFTSCSRTPTKAALTPEEQIVHELSNRRIVMLGDPAHEFPLSFYSVTSTLSTWLTMLERGDTQLNHLTLVLEASGHEADMIRQYTRTGDISPYLDYALPSICLEHIEFFSDLRALVLRIDSLNCSLPPDKQITFDIQGPEAVSALDPALIDLSAKESLLFFVNKRDSLAAQNVVNYLREHPLQKVLAFYGNGHLAKHETRKTASAELDASQSTGKWLAWYLKHEYGDDQVFTIHQAWANEVPEGSVKASDKNALFMAEEVPWKKFPMPSGEDAPANFDAFLIRHEVRLAGHSLARNFSRRVITAAIGRMELTEPHQSGYFGQRYLAEARHALTFVCDTTLPTASAWRSWWQGSQVEPWERLQAASFRQRLAADYYQQFDPEHLQDLEALGFGPRFGNPRAMSREQWDEGFEKIWPEVLFLNAVGLAWTGDTKERAEAAAYLVKYSSQHYNDPGQYLKWWRKSSLGASY